MVRWCCATASIRERIPGASCAVRSRAPNPAKAERPVKARSRPAAPRLQCKGDELADEGRAETLRLRRAREGQDGGVERRQECARAEASTRDQEGRSHPLL